MCDLFESWVPLPPKKAKRVKHTTEIQKGYLKKESYADCKEHQWGAI